MKLSVPFVQLPVQFDHGRLLEEMRALDPSSWMEHPQKFPGNFALPLISVGGDPLSDAIAGPMRPTPNLQRCPYLTQVLHRIGAVWGRTRLMKLSGGAEVTPHADISYYWRQRARVHVPIVTKPGVRFMCGDREVNMAAGECWIFDTWRPHRVINAADDERIHLVADTVGSESFWDMVGRGRAPGQGAFDGWRAEPFLPTSNDIAELAYESVNVPEVMTPWEMREHLMFLLGEVQPHPQLGAAQQAVARFLPAWFALWAQYGTDQAGWPRYRALLDGLDELLGRVAAPLQLKNGAQFVACARAMIMDVALADRSKNLGAYEPRAPASASPAKATASRPGRDPDFDRPVFVVSSPRSGSTLLFETLAQAPGLTTIGRESHALIEGMPALNAGMRGFESNRLTAVDATPAVTGELRQRLLAELRDREGRPPAQRPIRAMEKTPKNALRVPFLAQVFPEAHFVYLYRDPRQTLSSMIEAWQSGNFRTYHDLPGWQGLPWSLLLVPDWRELNGRPLPEIVAAQWERTTRILLDDLDALPAERRHVVRFDAFLADPGGQMRQLCDDLGLAWDRALAGTLPLSRHTVSPPDTEKWRRHADLIEPLLPALQDTIDRANRFIAEHEAARA
ncbi:sulfotransferase [Rhodanobacter lindaniclasticus]|uniref:Aspartyl/asparaginy/proline hydroxylase domain-containing protein n=1 Tax=Rhodanobacter lindaniclasticus TaxID=75310 RepID=A0A4S3KJU1_9GAMM|nr:sulfotransferase [Rhodanobacter lindaniclasticus]THD09065.1 hypothetical protein B1991_03355 [Rhodanobacter lindaniclasticus]